jgi:tetratricopeptide (TPR) repeat protein
MTSPTENPDLLARNAMAMLERQQHRAAETSSRRALALQPDHLGALTALALTLTAQARYPEAVQAFSGLTRRSPLERSHWVNLGTTLRATGRHDEALNAYARAAQLGEASPDFSYNVGLLHIDRGDYESARAVLARAMKQAPQDAEIRYQYAHCCYESVHNDEALEALAHWPELGGLTTDLVAKIALLLINLGEPQRALDAVQRARRDPQPTPQAQLTLLQVEERTNQLTAAAAALERLRADPRAAALGTELTLARAQIAQRQDDHAAACELFREIDAACTEDHRRHYHLFHLAKSLDALRRHEEACVTMVQAHRSQVAQLHRTAHEAAARRKPPMYITRFGCDAADVAHWNLEDAPAAAQSPVFIVAFPRSGTTLLEQTLDAHPALRSMDEQPYLQNAIDVLLEEGIGYPEKMAGATGQQLERARARYWELVHRKVALEPGQRLIDKNPLNILRLPAIRRLFPNSPILHAYRHPCDVILSCYMQHFRAPEFALMCRDLPTLALGFRRAVDFWYQQAALLRPPVREVRYETFVADFENEVRGIAAFLGLTWDDAMLAPAEHARAKGFISTPSYSQVIQPVHSRSIGRWKAYEGHFEPVIALIQPCLERWGYVL